jgi:hypothetical protein
VPPIYCLPCRRSRVRIPSAALKKTGICSPFLRGQSACASASGRTDSGLAAGRSSAVPTKTACLQVDSGSSEPKSFCGPAEGQVFGLLRPLPTTPAARARPCGQRPPARHQGRGPWGPVRFQSGNREVNLAPRRDPASHGPQRRELLRRTPSEAAARSPSRGASVAAVTRATLDASSRTVLSNR